MFIFQIQDLQVKRHTFEGVQITGSFLLKNVIVQRTPSLAFAFDSVNEFTILGSRFDRVSMWGFKLEQCNEFNALGESRFFSLASQAFHMKCQKFMLAYNTFDNLQDSSMGVRYGVADIQGNTFEKLTGKPFVDLRPLIESVSIDYDVLQCYTKVSDQLLHTRKSLLLFSFCKHFDEFREIDAT